MQSIRNKDVTSRIPRLHDLLEALQVTIYNKLLLAFLSNMIVSTKHTVKSWFWQLAQGNDLFLHLSEI